MFCGVLGRIRTPRQCKLRSSIFIALYQKQTWQYKLRNALLALSKATTES